MTCPAIYKLISFYVTLYSDIVRNKVYVSITKYFMVQIFPLLIQQFSKEEQASLMWQFFCNVPVVLLEDLFPWTLSFLSPDEQMEVTCCIKAVVPEEKSLLEVDLNLATKLLH